MSCHKNSKKFLFFKWDGEHDNTIEYISAFMRGNTHFVVDYRCKLCGAKSIRHFVQWDELLKLGFTNEQLEDIRWSYFGSSFAERDSEK